MASGKDKHYWSQLRAAITGGQWAAATPAKAPNGTPLSWAELLRKFNKHCRGFSDIAELASQTQALALLLAAKGSSQLSDRDLDGDEASPLGPLALGDECVLLEERQEEARAGYNTLKQLEGAHSDSVKFALAYYAFALGFPEECLAHLASIPNIPDVQSHIPSSSTVRSMASTTLTVPGRSDTPSSTSGGSFTNLDPNPTPPDVSDGRAWSVTEIFRSICLQGMSIEKLHPSEPRKALDTYITALPILASLTTEAARPTPSTASSPSGPGKLDFAAFSRYREPWRWAERLLWRAIVLACSKRTYPAADAGADDALLWNLFEKYRACLWPPTFRTEHRATVAVLQIRAYVLRARDEGGVRVGAAPVRQPAWVSTVRQVIQEYQAVLTVSTSFPRAGERNVKVEEFVDLCVAVWDACGAVGDHAGWVIDVLWWATRYTFNSYRIYRHMARLLYVSGDSKLATRFLRLYVQVVSKAREATNASGSEAAEGNGDRLSIGLPEIDSDMDWVRACVRGARMLCRLALVDEGVKGVEEAREAGKMVVAARTRLKETETELVASVDLAEGIWNNIMAIKEQEPGTRMDRLSTSLSLIQRSVDTHPTASGYHHLAIMLSRPGPSNDLPKAIECARLAVELDYSEVRHWHLLGLLEAAVGDWKKARSVLDVGAAIGEADLAPSEGDAANGGGDSEANGVVQARDFAHEGLPPTNGDVDAAESDSSSEVVVPRRTYLLEEDATEIPPASMLLLPAPDHPPPSHQELFEHALQLRMTQLALAEYIEGAEGVGDNWTEVFAWFAGKKGTDAEKGKSTPHSSLRQAPVQAQPQARHSVDIASAEKPTPLAPMPIMVTPATPAEGAYDGPPRSASMDSSRSSLDESVTEKGHSSSAGKKVQRMVKNSVHKGQTSITTISRKIGHGVKRQGSLGLRSTASAPDFQNSDEQSQYHASSIHSRRYYAPSMTQRSPSPASTAPTAPPPPPQPESHPLSSQKSFRTARDRRLLGDLWLMSAANFRRLGKIEQTRGAIQEAEVTDENNPAVWVQLGLYFVALGNDRRAIDTFHKALFIAPDDVPAIIHLCRIYLSAAERSSGSLDGTQLGDVDLAAGMLEEATRGAGWDVPEAWYFLAKAYGLQGRRVQERECLLYALELAEGRGVREIGASVGWCL